MVLSRLRGEAKTRAVAAANGSSLRVAQVQPAGTDTRPRVVSFEEQPITQDPKSVRDALRRANLRKVSGGIALIPPADYQFMPIEKVDVPAEELRAAMKWKLKDIAGRPPEEFNFDLLAIPGADGLPENARSMYAVIAANDTLRHHLERLEQAGFKLSVIDIPETAQRNLATLYEEADRGTALVFFDDSGGLLTISSRGELYHARRLDVKYSDLAGAAGEARGELLDRIVLELQRTLDNFERQFSFITLNRVLLGPEPADSGLLAYLRGNLPLPVEPVTLESVLEFADHAPELREQWRFFHLFGCALRSPEPPG